MTALPALAVIEMGSLSRAYVVLDAVVKKAPVTVAQFAEVTPGKTVLVFVGEVSPVEESVAEGRVVAGDALLDHLFLPGVHPAVVAMVLSRPIPPEVDALAVLETTTACAAVRAADAGLKAAEVGLLKIRLAAGIGGKGLDRAPARGGGRARGGRGRGRGRQDAGARAHRPPPPGSGRKIHVVRGPPMARVGAGMAL